MRFVESILFQSGVYHNLDLHQQRMNRTFNRFLTSFEPNDLNSILPKIDLEGTYKVRLEYDLDAEEVNYDLEFIEYFPRKIKTLQLVKSSSFDYSYKFQDRSRINQLLRDAKADEIIISIDGIITDSSYANLVFWDGKDWFTPNTPLLKGVRRTQLLAENKIKERPINIDDLKSFKKVSLINAMLDLEEIVIPIDQIVK